MCSPSGGSAGSASTITSRSHYYSVPHRFVRAEVEVRFTARTVEIFHKGERIAAHQRMSGNHKHTTVPEHMASSHRRHAGWTIERIRKEAATIGPATAALCDLILDERASGTGLPRLSRHHPARSILRARAARCRRHAGDRHRRAHLRLRQIDPRQQSRSASFPQALRG
jgi:hypothetical protein